MRARKAIRLLFVSATVLLSIGAAQVSSTRAPTGDPQAVTVTFFAEDEHGNPVTTLLPSDLSVRDNGKPPLNIISLGSAKDLPLRLGILINTNRSRQGWPLKPARYDQFVRAGLDLTQKAVLDFLQQTMTRPEDTAFIATYASLRRGATFVARDELQPIDLGQFLEGDAPDFIGMYDAVRIASTEVFGPSPVLPERRILIVFPGREGRSLSDNSETVFAAERAGVRVLFAECLDVDAIGEFHRTDWGIAQTGGCPVAVPTLGLPEWFGELKSQIDSMYSFAYIPEGPYQPGKLRRLDLKIPANKDWRVYAPKRYLTPTSP